MKYLTSKLYFNKNIHNDILYGESFYSCAKDICGDIGLDYFGFLDGLNSTFFILLKHRFLWDKIE